MATVTLKEAQTHLGKLIHGLSPDEEIIIVEHDRAIARVVLTASELSSTAPRKLGFLAGSVTAMAADFGAPLEDMQEHMQ